MWITRCDKKIDRGWKIHNLWPAADVVLQWQCDHRAKIPTRRDLVPVVSTMYSENSVIYLHYTKNWYVEIKSKSWGRGGVSTRTKGSQSGGGTLLVFRPPVGQYIVANDVLSDVFPELVVHWFGIRNGEIDVLPSLRRSLQQGTTNSDGGHAEQIIQIVKEWLQFEFQNGIQDDVPDYFVFERITYSKPFTLRPP